jgi:predicted nucleotidyltransferase
MINLESNLIRQILAYFFINDRKKVYLRELAKILTIDPGNLSKKLSELENKGILESETAGRLKFFFLNPRYPLLKEIKKIYEAQYSLPILLKEALAPLSGLKEAYIFGSYAKDSLSDESDIDVLLIGSHRALEARKVVLPLQKRLGREINMIDFTLAEYKNKKKNKDDFLKNILAGDHIRIR